MKPWEIFVCIKPVPDPRYWHALRLDENTKTLRREGIPSIINPLDKNALEEALRLKEGRGGKVTVISMAPPSAKSLLHEALAMGGDEGILISDPALAGGDTLATARTLASAIRKKGDWDLIICGQESLDGSTAQVGPQLAALLKIPFVGRVEKVELMEGGEYLHVMSRTERGRFLIRARIPVLLCVLKEINTPRYTTFTGILEAEKKEIYTWDREALGLKLDEVGLKGSPTQMADWVIPQMKRKVERLKGEPEWLAERIMERLYRFGIL
ncbi:MAG: electron transfer flavoprotein subunit beta/FixA family protein [Candidatus Bathyarchaeia archaeon]